jgi:hypothetical protein
MIERFLSFTAVMYGTGTCPVLLGIWQYYDTPTELFYFSVGEMGQRNFFLNPYGAAVVFSHYCCVRLKLLLLMFTQKAQKDKNFHIF